MSVIFTDSGNIKLLDLMLKTALLVDESFTLHLYQNDYTPAIDSVVGNFTECDFTNYSAKSLSRSQWTASITVDGAAYTSYGIVQTWTCGITGNAVYGAYLLDGGGSLLWAERFTNAPVNLANTSVIAYTPAVALAMT